MWRKALLSHRHRIGVSGTKEPIRADDAEAHRVLTAVSDAGGLLLAASHPVGPRVGGDEQRTVGRVDPEAVYVNRAGIPRLEQVRDRASAIVGIAPR